MDTIAVAEDAVLWLDQAGPGDRAQVGGKAANLGALAQAGLPVPSGFCLPAWLLARNEAIWWPLAAEAYHRLAASGEAVAVRSSAAGEDSPGASFAGQFATVLGVKDEAGLRRAIAACRASAGGDRARQYGERLAGEAGGLSVLVQLQVPAEASGVLFTRHPLTGETRHLLLEAAPGLGEALVSGRVAPLRATLEKDGRLAAGSLDGEAGPLLTKEQLGRLAGLAARVEAVLGPGQDIEWALAGGEICLLQARPVTTGLAERPAAGIWTRANVGEVLPGPVTPLTWAVFRATLQGDLSGLLEGQEEDEGDRSPVRRIFGRVYLRLDAMLDSFCYLPGVTPEVVARALGTPLPAAAAYTLPSGPAVRLAQAAFLLDGLGLLPRMEILARRLPPLPPAGRMDALLDWTRRCFGLHLKATAYAAGAFGLLSALLARWAPEVANLLPALLQGRGDLQTADQGRQLWRLAGELRRSPELAALVQSGSDWAAFQAKAPHLPGGPELLAAFAAFLEANGARAAGEFELAVPRWREEPDFLIGVLRGYLDTGDAAPVPDPASPGRQAATLAAGSHLGLLRGFVFRHLLASYSRFSTLRENLKYRLMEAFAALRLSFLEKGGSLKMKGVLESAEEIYFLTPAEIRALEQGRLSPQEARSRLEGRRSQHSRWSAETAPDLLLGEGAAVAGETPAGPEPGVLIGIGCSPGVVTGIARVLTGIEQASDLRPGEILVAPHTDPGWTPLFLSCKAVITEIGGFLSHGATVAREYGIPCVVNVPAAAARIRTGDRIRVDGASGRITIL
jgi:pyruvate,water dikinase